MSAETREGESGRQAEFKIQNSKFKIAAAWPWVAAVASGLLLTLCFPRWNQGWLCWVALAPVISALFFSQHRGRFAPLRKAALGYLTGWVFTTASFYWLSTTLSALYANVWLLALAPLVGMVFGFYFAFWGWFVGAILVRAESAPRFSHSLSNLGVACAGAGAWVMQEWVRERLFGGFGWNDLGVALHRDLAMIQITDITGVPGLSFLVAFCNFMAVIIVRRIAGELGPAFLKRVRWEFSFTVALVALVLAYGVRTLLRSDSPPTVPLRVVAVQPNIPQTEKFDPEEEDNILRQLGELTALATIAPPAPQLVLWPEASTPRGMFADQKNYDFVIGQAARGDFGLLIGTVDFDPKLAEDYNTAMLLTERGARQQSSRKIHLVPFGEYLPLRPVFSGFVGQLVPSDFSPGREFTVMQLADPPIKLSTLICFEDTLGDLTRRFAARGAQVLVNITNDGWFAQSPAAEQHLANAVFRAVENRRPLIRCGNTGVTCAVDPFGRVDPWLAPFQRGFAAREIRVPTTPRATFYTRHGDWFSGVSAALTLLLAVALRRRAK